MHQGDTYITFRLDTCTGSLEQHVSISCSNRHIVQHTRHCNGSLLVIHNNLGSLSMYGEDCIIHIMFMSQSRNFSSRFNVSCNLPTCFTSASHSMHLLDEFLQRNEKQVLPLSFCFNSTLNVAITASKSSSRADVNTDDDEQEHDCNAFWSWFLKLVVNPNIVMKGKQSIVKKNVLYRVLFIHIWKDPRMYMHVVVLTPLLPMLKAFDCIHC